MHQNCIRHGRHRSDNFCLSIQFILQRLHLCYYSWKQQPPPPPLCNNDHVCLLFQFRFVSQVQWAPTDEKVRSPTATADKGFLCSKGKVRGWTSLSLCHIRNGFHNRRRSSLSALSTTRPTTTGRRSPSTSPSTTTPRSRSRPSG